LARKRPTFFLVTYQQNGWTMTTKTLTEDEIIIEGLKAFARLRKNSVITFDLWIKVGQGLEVGKQKIMHQLRINRIDTEIGRKAFSSWLRETGYDAVPRPERSYLDRIIENLSAVQEWYAGLSEAKRLRYNHPATVWRNWSTNLNHGSNTKTVVKLNDQIVAASGLILKIATSHGESVTDVMRMIRQDIAARREKAAA
jgi:hypothetical protein